MTSLSAPLNKIGLGCRLLCKTTTLRFAIRHSDAGNHSNTEFLNTVVNIKNKNWMNWNQIYLAIIQERQQPNPTVPVQQCNLYSNVAVPKQQHLLKPTGEFWHWDASLEEHLFPSSKVSPWQPNGPAPPISLVQVGLCWPMKVDWVGEEG